MKKKIWGIIAGAVALAALIVAGIIFIPKWFGSENNGPEPTYPEGITWYNIHDKEFHIKDRQGLLDMVVLSEYFDFADQKVILDNDIVLNDGDASEWKENAPALNWTPIKNFAGTFDGNGHKISGLYMKGTDMRMALFLRTKETAVIENLSIVNSLITGSGSYGAAAFAVWGGGTFRKLYTDITIDIDGGFAAGIASRFQGGTFDTCWFDGNISITNRYAGMITDVPEDYSETAISHCLATGTLRNDVWTESTTTLGGMCSCIFNYSILKVEDCLTSGKIISLNPGRDGSILGGGDTTSEPTITNCFATSESCTFSVSSSVSNLVGGAIAIPEEDLSGDGGFAWTYLDFENYWAIDENGTPVLRAFLEGTPKSTEGIKKAFDTEWYDENKKEFVLNNKNELYGFAFLSMSNNFEGKTVKLNTDLTFIEDNANYKDWYKPESYPLSPLWITIGSKGNPFEGTFDGQGHKISGLFLTGTGVFGDTGKNSCIKNLSILNSTYITSGTNSGLLAGIGNGTFDSIYTNGLSYNDGETAQGFGGMVGMANNGFVTFTNCWWDGTVMLMGSNAQMVGGILGRSQGGSAVTFSHCLATGTGIGNRTAGGFNNLGGIMGWSYSGSEITIEDCVVKTAIVPGVAASTGKPVGGCGLVMGQIGANSTCYILDTILIKSDDKTVFSTAIGATNGTGEGSPETYVLNDVKGLNAYKKAELDFEKYWACIANDFPHLQTFTDEASILATAGVEKDYDISWYNKRDKAFTLTTTKQLMGLSKLSMTTNFKGKTINLGANITMNSGSAASWVNGAAPANKFNGIGAAGSKAFAGTFDGKGHTISGLYMDVAGGNQGLFNAIATSGVVQNLRITNSCVKSSGTGLGSVAGRNGGLVKNCYSDAYVIATGDNNSRIGGIVGAMMDAGYESYVEDCWFAGQVEHQGVLGQQVGGIVGAVASDNTAYIRNCLMTGWMDTNKPSADGFCNMGGILGISLTSSGVPTAHIENCFVDAKAHTYKGKEVKGLNNSSGGSGFILGQCGKDTVAYVVNSYATTSSSSLSAVGATNGELNGGGTSWEADSIKGLEAARWLELDFKNHWACIDGKVPALRAFGPAGILDSTGIKLAYDNSWYNEKASTYVLTDALDLLGFAMMTNKTNFAGKTVTLGADIVMNAGSAEDWAKGINCPELSWPGTGTFSGTFDGQGHTISGLYANSDLDMLAFISKTGRATKSGVTYSPTVRNFKLVNSYFRSSANMRTAGIVGRAAGTIENVYCAAIVENTAPSGWAAGGIVGEACDGLLEVRNCEFAGRVTMLGTTKSQEFGGIVGATAGLCDLRVDNCLFSGKLTGSFISTGGYSNAGGILGINYHNSTTEVKATITNCVSAGTIEVTGSGGIGMIIGQNGAGAIANISNCYTTEGLAYSGTYPDAVKAASGNYNETIGDFTKATARGAFGANNGTGSINVMTLPQPIFYGAASFPYINLNLSGAWCLVDGKAPQLRVFTDPASMVDTSTLAKIDTSWFDASKTEFEIDSAAKLNSLYILTQSNDMSGKTFKLTQDIILNEGYENYKTWGTNAPANSFMPIGSFGGTKFNGTIDGKGHAIIGMYIKSVADGIGLIAEAGNQAVVKNLNILNSYLETSGRCIASVAGRGSGTYENIYSNAYIVAAAEGSSSSAPHADAGGIIGQTCYGSDGVLVKNCWFDGTILGTGLYAQFYGGIVASANRATASDNFHLTIEDCLFTGYISCARESGNNAAGIIAVTESNPVVTVKNCLSAGQVVAPTSQAGSVVGLIYNGANDTFTNVYALKNSCTLDKAIGGNSGSTVTGAPVEVTYASLVGNTAKTTLSGFDFENTWSAVDGKLPILKGLTTVTTNKQVVADTSWYDEAGTEFTITTKEQYLGFLNLASSNTLSGKVIKLGANIVLNENSNQYQNWGVTPPDVIYNAAGRKASSFQGTFDGQGYALIGLYQNTSAECATGIVGVLGTDGVVKNVKIKNAYIKTLGAAGSVVGRINGAATIENVYSDAIIVTGGNTGGIVGQIIGQEYSQAKIESSSAKASIIKDVWFDGKVISKPGVVGGIAANVYQESAVEISGSSFTGEIEITSGTGTSYVGGIIGRIPNTQNGGRATIKDSVSGGTIKATNQIVGTIIGQVDAGQTASITDVYAAYVKNRGFIGSDLATGKAVGITLLLADLQGENGYKNTNLPASFGYVTGKAPVPASLAENPISTGSLTKAELTWFNPENTEFELTTPGELDYFSILSQGSSLKGYTFKLAGDIQYNSDYQNQAYLTNASARKWNPIGQNDAFEGTFNGAGATIYGLYTKCDGVAALFAKTKDAIIRNVKIDSSYFEGVGASAVVSEANGGIFDSIQVLATTTVKDSALAQDFTGTILATADGDIVMDIIYAAKTVVGKVRTGKVTMTNLYAEGLAVAEITADAEVTVDKAIIKNLKAVSSNNGTVTFTNTYLPNDATETATGITKVDFATLKGDNAKTVLTEFDFTIVKIWTAQEGELPIPSAFYVKPGITADTSWYVGHEGDTTYHLTTIQQFAGFAKLVNGGTDFAGKTIYQDSNFTLNDVTNFANWGTNAPAYGWTPIGTKATPFKGIYDGQKHLLTGFYSEASEAGKAGLFGAITGAILENIIVTKSYFRTAAGSIGGLVNFVQGGKIVACDSRATVIAGGDNVGGIIGEATTAALILDAVQFDGSLTVSGTRTGIGGIVGLADGISATISNVCFDRAKVTAADCDFGTLFGKVEKSSDVITIGLFYANIENSGDLSTKASAIIAADAEKADAKLKILNANNPAGSNVLTAKVVNGDINSNGTFCGVYNSTSTGTNKTRFQKFTGATATWEAQGTGVRMKIFDKD